MIKVVLFDISGVQITLEDDEFCKIISKKFKIPFKTVEAPYLRCMAENESGKISEEEFYKCMYKDLGIISTKKLILWTKKLRVELRKVIPGVRGIISKLKKNYVLATVSNDAKEPAIRTNKLFKFDKLFDRMFYAYQVGARKNNKLFFDNVLKTLKVRPEECVYIDDSKKYLVLTKELGFNVIHFKNKTQLRKDLKKLGVF